MNKTTFIYALIDPRTNNIRYVGRADNPYKRFYSHIGDKSITYKTNWIKSLLKIGLIPKLKILEQCPVDIWGKREKHWIAFGKINKWPLTNLTDGGEGNVGWHPTEEQRINNSKAKKGNKCHLGYHHSIEARNKISKALKGKIGPNKGKHFSLEIRKKLSESHKGHHPSEETRLKLSECHKGNKHWLWGKCHSAESIKKMSDIKKGKRASDKTKNIMSEHSAWRGKHLTKEHCKKISEARKGMAFSEEHKKHLSEALMGHKNNLGRFPSEESKRKMSESRKRYLKNKKVAL